MKSLQNICEGILTSIDNDIDNGVAIESIFTYLKRPHDFEWTEFLYTVEKWAQQFGPIGGLYHNKKLCGNQPVVFIGEIEKVHDDHFKLKVSPNDIIVAIFCCEDGGARLYAEAPDGMAQVKKIPAWSSLTISDEVSHGKEWTLLADMPYYDQYYRFRSEACYAYNLPKTDAKKIAKL